MKCIVTKIERNLYNLFVNAETTSIEDDYQMEFSVISLINGCYELKAGVRSILMTTAPERVFVHGKTCITHIIKALLVANKFIDKDAKILFFILEKRG